MLPFMKKKNEAGTSAMPAIHDLTPKEPEPSEDQENPGLNAAAHDLMEGITARDPQRVAAALKAAFEMMEMAPHAEGEHIESIEE